MQNLGRANLFQENLIPGYPVSEVSKLTHPVDGFLNLPGFGFGTSDPG